MKSGYACVENKTMRFGGPLSKPENVFAATLHQVPPYQITYQETYGSGGWIEGTRTVTETITNTFLVIRDGTCIGVIFEPYATCLHIKTTVYPIGTYPGKHLSAKDIIEKEIHKLS